MGLTINIMVMFGLMLSIGLLIDASIVVVEYAQQLIEDGQDSSEAFAEAAHRMWIPVLTSTATTLCAFLPLLFWPGVPGEFMRYFPITLIFVLTASFLSATIILPVLGAMMSEIFLKKKPSLDISHEVASCGHDSYSKSKSARKKKGKSVNRQEHFFMRLFSKFLYTTLFSARNTVLCLVCASLLLAGIVVVYARHNNGVEFFVKTDPFQVVLHVRARGNLSIEERDKLVKKVEQRIIAIDEFSGLFSKANAAGSESRDAPTKNLQTNRLALPRTILYFSSLHNNAWNILHSISNIRNNRSRISSLFPVYKLNCYTSDTIFWSIARFASSSVSLGKKA
jgi:multidrug efflux pump